MDPRKTAANPREKNKEPTRHVEISLTLSHRLKHSVVFSVVGSRHQAGSTHQAGTHVAHNVAIKVRHDHHIKLLRPGNQLKHTQKSSF